MSAPDHHGEHPRAPSRSGLDESTRRELTAIVARLEDVDWRRVPGVSPATAAAFVAAIDKALERSRRNNR